MNKNKQVILQNPFHPLDLSPHDLLSIYKRFQQSRIVNRNPKQQLPIEVIAQLISSLKGCSPSYIQKCISQALIKQTISWNQFLTFLDQQSEVRQKILEWLMYEKTTIKYQQGKEWPIRAKINSFYEELTFVKFVQLGQNDKLLLACVDKVKFYLFTEFNGKITLIDKYQNKSEHNYADKTSKDDNDPFNSQQPSKIVKNQSRIRNKTNLSKTIQKPQLKEIQKAVNMAISSAPKLPESAVVKQDDQQYYRKQRKNINSLFNIFKDLDNDYAVSYARAIIPKLNEKSLNPNSISQLKQIYAGGVGMERNNEKKVNTSSYGGKPLDTAYGYLKKLQRQKRMLSYNPYLLPKNRQPMEGQILRSKKITSTITKERKIKQYTHEGNQKAYNDKLKCFAVIFYNMELVLVKLVKQFNKISLQEQDKIKIHTENQHKKNQIIEAIDFYFHTIVNKWFIITLIRVQYKNQLRNQNQSYVRGYQIELIQNKRRSDKDYRFKHKKQAFSFFIQCRDKSTKKQEYTKNQVFKMVMQTQYGIHFISVNGKYICFKEDFIKTQTFLNTQKRKNDRLTTQLPKSNEDIYFFFYYQQKFKNTGLSLNCLSINVEINKIVFGTIRGMVIIYDIFSHFFKIKKVSNSQIVQIKIVGTLAYILTSDQKFILLDLIKVQQIQSMSIKNESKLHQKVKRMQVYKNSVYFYGSQLRSYNQFVDEMLLHQRRKMQTIYKWRLDKLFKQQYSLQKQNKYQTKQIKKLLPRAKVSNNSSTIQMVLDAQYYFFVLTEILQLIVIQKKTMKIKFTMILGIPHDSKVMKMAFSQNQKLLALLLFNQNIYIFNIHTQDQYQLIKSSPFLKYTTFTFLDRKNQYLLANGTQNGKIILTPYNSIPQKSQKVLDHHKLGITALVVAKKQYLVSCGEDCRITIWLLPFNVLKHQIKLDNLLGCVIEEIGCFKEFAYFKKGQEEILQVNTHQGKLVNIIKQFGPWIYSKIDSCTGQIVQVSKNRRLELISKTKQTWTKKSSMMLESTKYEVKGLSIVSSQKAVLFFQNGIMLPWAYQGQIFGKGINICQE